MSEGFSFDNTLDGLMNSSAWNLGTKYLELKTAKENKDANDATILADQMSKDKLYNAQANIPANTATPQNNLINSWDSIPLNYKIVGLVAAGAVVFMLVKK